MIRIRLSLALLILALAPFALAQDYVEGEVIIKLRGDATVHGMSKVFGKAGQSAKDLVLKRSWGRLNMHKMALKPGQSVQDMIMALQDHPDVEFVEPNYYVNKQATGVEGERINYFEAQKLYESSSIETQGTGYAQSYAPIQIEEAWNLASSTSFKPIVAVIDTGVDYNHPVFVNSGAIWQNTHEIAGNGIDDDDNGYIDDVIGWNFVTNSNGPMDDDDHGTHVAGIVLGTTQNILAASLDPAKIRIMPLKFLDSQGRGTTADAISAIYYAVNNGAHVLNNSWGGGGYSESLRDAITFAYEEGVTFVAAAGNASNNNDVSATYPANYTVPNVFSIAATTDSDYLASFSNFGKQTVQVASPGVSIYSTLPDDSMGFASGTSMAAPFVSGVAALILREAPELTGYQTRSIISDASNTLSSLKNKVFTEARINVYGALNIAKNGDLSVYDAGPPASYGQKRGVAAEMSNSPSGCAMATLLLNPGSGGGPSGPMSFRFTKFFTILFLLMAPVFLIMWMKSHAPAPRTRRRYERYRVDTEVRIRAGDRELVGAISSISLGGVRIDVNELLEQGGVVEMKIKAPNGEQMIEATGQIVWCEERKAYGVAFTEIEDKVRSAIAHWQKALVKI